MTKPRGNSKIIYTYWKAYSGIWHKPTGRGGTWKVADPKNCNAFLWGTYTGIHSNGRSLIMMEGVDMAGGDGNVDNGILSVEAALANIR